MIAATMMMTAALISAVTSSTVLYMQTSDPSAASKGRALQPNRVRRLIPSPHEQRDNYRGDDLDRLQGQVKDLYTFDGRKE
jgi:hypothetical protein